MRRRVGAYNSAFLHEDKLQDHEGFQSLNPSIDDPVLPHLPGVDKRIKVRSIPHGARKGNSALHQ